MITSYGSDESDSDTADENHSKNGTSSTPLNESNISLMTKSNNVEMFSAATPVVHPQILTTSQKTDQEYDNKTALENTKVEITVNSKSSEEKETHYLKNPVKSLQEFKEPAAKPSSDSRIVKESKTAVAKKSSSKHNPKSDLDFRISLVPGYDEESDAEEESDAKHEKKALFPIPQTEDMESTSSTHGTMQNKHIVIEDNQVTDSNDSDVDTEKNNTQELNNENISEKAECAEKSGAKSEEDVQKSNKFLDSFHGQNKFFQRKKRIAFDGKNIDISCRFISFT